MSISDLFDKYSREARLQPALLVLVPVFVTIAVWLPTVYSLGVTLAGLLVTCGVCAWLANVARSLGRKEEKRLCQAWGGKPTTIWLRRSDSHLDAITKERYYVFLQAHVAQWQTPTEQMEGADGKQADVHYESATRWLLEYTRDTGKFPLVFKENIAYGFRRNMLGLKPIGLTVSAGSSALNGIAATEFFWKSGGTVHTAGVAVLALSITILALWIFIVRDEWVRDVGDAYAKALLGACEGLKPA